MWVSAFEREVPEDEPHDPRVTIEQHPDGRFRATAHRALEIAIFNECDPRMRITANGISWMHGNNQIVARLHFTPRASRSWVWVH
jgi:hypothetical protein